MKTKKQKIDDYTSGKKRVPFLQGNSVLARMFRMMFFGSDKQK